MHHHNRFLLYLTNRRALLLLRKKKYQEGLLARTDGQLDNLERLVHDLEFAQVEKQVKTRGAEINSSFVLG